MDDKEKISNAQRLSKGEIINIIKELMLFMGDPENPKREFEMMMVDWFQIYMIKFMMEHVGTNHAVQMFKENRTAIEMFQAMKG